MTDGARNLTQELSRKDLQTVDPGLNTLAQDRINRVLDDFKLFDRSCAELATLGRKRNIREAFGTTLHLGRHNRGLLCLKPVHCLDDQKQGKGNDGEINQRVDE